MAGRRAVTMLEAIADPCDKPLSPDTVRRARAMPRPTPARPKVALPAQPSGAAAVVHAVLARWPELVLGRPAPPLRDRPRPSRRAGRGKAEDRLDVADRASGHWGGDGRRLRLPDHRDARREALAVFWSDLWTGGSEHEQWRNGNLQRFRQRYVESEACRPAVVATRLQWAAEIEAAGRTAASG